MKNLRLLLIGCELAACLTANINAMNSAKAATEEAQYQRVLKMRLTKVKEAGHAANQMFIDLMCKQLINLEPQIIIRIGSDSTLLGAPIDREKSLEGQLISAKQAGNYAMHKLIELVREQKIGADATTLDGRLFLDIALNLENRGAVEALLDLNAPITGHISCFFTEHTGPIMNLIIDRTKSPT